MTELVIRAATETDANAIAFVHVEAWKETYEGLIPDPRLAALNLADRADRWTKILRDTVTPARTSAFIVEVNDRAVGFGSYGGQRSELLASRGFDGEIEAIYLLKIAQRRGVGRRLMGLMATALIDRGFAGGSVWVLRNNVGARHFYETLGAGILVEREEQWNNETRVAELAYGWPDLSLLVCCSETRL
ncbi:MAG: GNAT family N-acetyltransferase [Pseudomonadota bacterium]